MTCGERLVLSKAEGGRRKSNHLTRVGKYLFFILKISNNAGTIHIDVRCVEVATVCADLSGW